MIKKWLIRYLLSDLLCGVDPRLIIKYDDKRKQIFLNGEIVNGGLLKQLKDEARIFEQSLIYKIFFNNVAEQARQKMFEKSMNYEDMFAGKTMLYNLDVLKRICEAIKEVKE